jgi:hypothetical protein
MNMKMNDWWSGVALLSGLTLSMEEPQPRCSEAQSSENSGGREFG